LINHSFTFPVQGAVVQDGSQADSIKGMLVKPFKMPEQKQILDKVLK